MVEGASESAKDHLQPAVVYAAAKLHLEQLNYTHARVNLSKPATHFLQTKSFNHG